MRGSNEWINLLERLPGYILEVVLLIDHLGRAAAVRLGYAPAMRSLVPWLGRHDLSSRDPIVTVAVLPPLAWAMP